MRRSSRAAGDRAFRARCCFESVRFQPRDAKTADHFFTGFPSYWNIVVFYLYLAGWPPCSSMPLLLLVLAILVFVPIRYVYPSRTPVLRSLTIGLGIAWGVLDDRDAVADAGSVAGGLLGVADFPCVLRGAVARARSPARRIALMNPIALHAHNPGPMTGAGQLDVADFRARADADRRWRRRTAASRRPRAGARRCAAGAGAGHPRAFRSRGWRDGDRRAHAVGAILKMPWPERDHRGRSMERRLLMATTLELGDTSLRRSCTRLGMPPITCASGTRTTRALFGGDLAIAGTTVWIPSMPGRRPGRLPRIARAGHRAESGADPSRPRADHHEPAALLRGYVAHRRERERQIDRRASPGRPQPVRPSSRASIRNWTKGLVRARGRDGHRSSREARARRRGASR